MTANQIAAQSNKIQQEIAANQLAEQQRHNEEIEGIEKQKLQLTADQNAIQESWNKWQQQWQRDYQYALKQYELAQEDERIAIQDQLAMLEERKQDYYRMHTDRIDELEKEKVRLEQEKLEVDKSFKQFQESSTWTTLGLSAWDKRIQEKRIEYDYSVRHEQNLINQSLGLQRLDVDRLFNIAQMDYKWADMLVNKENLTKRLSNELQIANLNYTTRMKELELATKRYDLDVELSKATALSDVASALYGRQGLIPGTVNLFNPFAITGGLYGKEKSAKQIAESLFSN